MVLGATLTQNSAKLKRKTKDWLRKSEPIRTNLNIDVKQLQLHFNDSIIAQLEFITRHIKNNLTKKSLKGMKMTIADLETRNKMIKIANKSPGG